MDYKKNYYVTFVKGFLFIDFDIDNPDCVDDPFVRIAYVEALPETAEEVARFVSDRSALGTFTELFPSYNGIDDLIKSCENDNQYKDCKHNIIRAWATHSIEDAYCAATFYQTKYLMNVIGRKNQKFDLNSEEWYDLVLALQDVSYSYFMFLQSNNKPSTPESPKG